MIRMNQRSLSGLLHSRKMSLIASLPANDPALARAAVDAGADSIKVHIGHAHHASGRSFGTLAQEISQLKEIIKISGERPVGIVPGVDPDGISSDLPELFDLGFTYLSIYAHHAPIAAFLGKFEMMLACGEGYAPEELAMFPKIGAHAVDASFLPHESYGTAPTARDLLQFAHLARTTGLPIVAPTQRRIRPQDVPGYARADVRAIMIGAIVTGNTPDSFYEATKAFREAIARL
jgi:hypothetical protein